MFRLLSVALSLAFVGAVSAADPWIVLDGKAGPGKGKHIVFVSGDEEYRSEEALPQLAKILATHHGFKCTVLFAIDPADGRIQPNISNIPGLEALQTADLMVIFTRFRHLPAEQMKQIVNYIDSGKPILGMRTATHAFQGSPGEYKKYDNGSSVKGWEGGFGKQILGEKWVAHHGRHGVQGTRGIIAPGQEKNPIVRGITPGSIFGTTDVYRVTLPLPGDSKPIVFGQVTKSLDPDSEAVDGPQNNPMMPVAWTRTYNKARVFTTTMGASEDLKWEGTRRLIVNAVYWCLGMEKMIPAKSNVEIVGKFNPSHFASKKDEAWKPGIAPAELLK